MNHRLAVRGVLNELNGNENYRETVHFPVMRLNRTGRKYPQERHPAAWGGAYDDDTLAAQFRHPNLDSMPSFEDRTGLPEYVEEPVSPSAVRPAGSPRAKRRSLAAMSYYQ